MFINENYITNFININWFFFLKMNEENRVNNILVLKYKVNGLYGYKNKYCFL